MSDLIVTRGDGVPVPDQAMGVELFKAQARNSYLERRILALEAALRELPFKIAEIPLEPKWSDYPVKQRDNTSKTDAYQLGHGIALLAAANLVRALPHDSQPSEGGRDEPLSAV